jgi:hypothetical protein
MAQVRSNTTRTKDGLDFHTDMDLYQMQWGKRFNDKWALGAGFGATISETTFATPVMESKTTSETYVWRFGNLYKPAENWLAGLVFEYGFSPSRTEVKFAPGLGIGDVKSNDTAHQFILRPGVSYEYKKDSTVFVDYQIGEFCDDTGSLMVHRFNFGIDHQIIRGLFVRGGATIDTNGGVTLGTGLGIYPADWVTIDVAYQENAFPELNRDLGRARMITVSVGFNF